MVIVNPSTLSLKITGDYQSFRAKFVLPIQRSFAARKELKQHQQQQHKQLLSLAPSSTDLSPPTVDNSASDTKAAARSETKNNNKKEKAALARFHQSIEVSAEGLQLLRTLHKQVGGMKEGMY